jgi:hypothetical protein
MGSLVQEWGINIYRGALIVRTLGTNRVNLSLVHTSNFVGDFVFLTDANEWTRTQKKRVAFQK